MGWIRIDDHYAEHPKILEVGPLGVAIWLAGLAYCNRNLTDGFIPWAKAQQLCSFETVEEDGKVWEITRTSGMTGYDIETEWVIDLLVSVGLWERVENGKGRIDGYQIHDYSDYQPTREQVLSEREAAKARMSKRRSGEVQAKFDNCSPSPNPNPKGTVSTPLRSVDACPVQSEPDAPVSRIFGHYKARILPRARLNPADKIRKRLKTYSEFELLRAVDNFADDWWCMTHNASRGATWFFHSDARIEGFLTMTPRTQQEEERKNGKRQTDALPVSDELREYAKRFD